MIKIEDFGKGKRQKGNVYFIEVKRRSMKKVIERLKEKGVDRITAITARDTGKVMEITYNFLIEKKSVNLRTELRRRKPSVETVADLFPGAVVLEREVHDLFGIDFRGSPNQDPILLDWNSPQKPLLKRS